jgi:queuine/archaeosine tRNA-ribosyltransferase
MHNLWFYQDLMRGIRSAIEAGDFDAWSRRVLGGLAQGPD